MSVRLSVCKPRSNVIFSAPNLDIAPIFFVQIPLINEHLFCKYCVRLSVVNATKGYATYGCFHPCFLLNIKNRIKFRLYLLFNHFYFLIFRHLPDGKRLRGGEWWLWILDSRSVCGNSRCWCTPQSFRSMKIFFYSVNSKIWTFLCIEYINKNGNIHK